MQLIRPGTLQAALSALDEPGARAIAGGTALQADWAQDVAKPDALVDLTGLLPAGIALGAHVEIGAATTLQAIREAGLPLLSQAASSVAAPNIRRLATLGGTIGWGKGCLLPALLVLDAEVKTTAGQMPLSDWLTAPEGLVLSVRFALPDHDSRAIWRKIGRRAAFSPCVIAVAGIGLWMSDRLSSIKLAVGGGPVAPVRLHAAERKLTGTTPGFDELERRISDAIDAPDCPFRTAAYRRRAGARALAHGLTDKAVTKDRERHLVAGLVDEIGGDRWHVRPDMQAKVTAQTAYLTDARRPGMLVARILRAAHPHARIKGIDTTAAESLPGVRAVVSAADIPGLNGFGIVMQDQPALCDVRVRYLGDAVAAVAAEDAETAARALDLIEVDYAPLPILDDPEAALGADAEALHANGNLVSELGLLRGDPEAAFAQAAHVVEETYVLPRQMHGFMETEGGWAEMQGDVLHIEVGGQHGARDRLQLSRITGLPEDRIRVVTSPTGGAFGGKDELTVQPALALLAMKVRAPIRLHLDRAESVRAGSKRNPMRIRMRTACDAEGRLVAQEVDLVSDCGAYASLSPGVMETAMEHAAGPYRVANVRTRGRLAYTNNGTGGAFRGFGANQMTFATECQMDRLARETGLNPIEIRRRNLRQPGDPGFLGQKLAPSERLQEMLDAASDSPLWVHCASNGEWKIGAGLGLMWQGNGLGTIPDDQGAGTLRLAIDGKIEVLCGLDEMGQGLTASLRAAVADRLGCARDDVRAVVGDTKTTPDAGSTSASRGGYVVWRLADLAGAPFAEKMIALAAAITGQPKEGLQFCPGGIGRRGRNRPTPMVTLADLAQAAADDLPEASASFPFPKTDYTKGNARFIFASAAVVAQVGVSRITGEVRVRALHMHTAAGPIIDLASYLGQMEGAVMQGLGFTLSEDVVMKNGRYLTGNLDTYMMPTIRDVPPDLAVTALETLDPGDPYGPRGAGELGIGGVTPAICNAVLAATGVHPSVIPIEPETILSGGGS